jgi:hypothetical protein
MSTNTTNVTETFKNQNLLTFDLDLANQVRPGYFMQGVFPDEFSEWFGEARPLLFFSKRPFPIASEFIPFLWLCEAFEKRFRRKIFLACENGATLWCFDTNKFRWDHLQSLRVPHRDFLEQSLLNGVEFGQFMGRVCVESQNDLRFELNPNSNLDVETTFPEWICDRIPKAISMRREGSEIVFAHPKATLLDTAKFLLKRFPEEGVARMVEFNPFGKTVETNIDLFRVAPTRIKQFLNS